MIARFNCKEAGANTVIEFEDTPAFGKAILITMIEFEKSKPVNRIELQLAQEDLFTLIGNLLRIQNQLKRSR